MGANRLLAELVQRGLRADSIPRELPERRDGLLWKPASGWDCDNSGFTVSRVSAGVWRRDRVAAGTETTHFAVTLSDLVRLTSGLGLKPIDLAIAYEIVAVAATSVDLQILRTTYANGVNPSAASLFSTGTSTLTLDSNHATAGQRAAIGVHLMTASIPSGKGFYENADDAIIVAELTVVGPINFEFKLFGGGFHVAHDYA